MKNRNETREHVRLVLRWGVWLCYTEWREDQPHEDWSGSLQVEGGCLRNPRQLLYHGAWGAQHRIPIELGEPRWISPRTDFIRPVFGYKGVEGLMVDVEGDLDTRLHFRTPMLSVDFRLKQIPEGDWLVFPAGPKYSCSQLVVCRAEDEGIYWNPRRAREATLRDGRTRLAFGLSDFRGDFLPRELHHRTGAWIRPGGTLALPLAPAQGPFPEKAVVTWRFTASSWAPPSDTSLGEIFSGNQSLWLNVATAVDGRETATSRLKVKYMRGAHSALEHVDEVEGLGDGRPHALSIVNRSRDKTYLVLNGVTIEQPSPHWASIRQHLPFKADGFDGQKPSPSWADDLPSGGRGLILGYDTNVTAAENGWIDAVIRFLEATGGGNYLLFRTESDGVTEADWRRWFSACRQKRIYFAINTSIHEPALPLPDLLRLAKELGGEYFVGIKQHELSIPLYAGWRKADYPPTRTLAEAESAYVDGIRKACRRGSSAFETLSDANSGGLQAVVNVSSSVPVDGSDARRLLGEAMLAHRYAYMAGVDLILSETMTGHTSLLLAEARGAARAYRRTMWGMHIACHVHMSPEDWRHERMFWLNLHLGYLSGASLIEDEEGGLAKVHSFVSGPSDPLPSARQATMAAFYRWAAQHPRRSPLKVDVGFIYGRHEAITGGMSLNTERPVRVWEGFGPAIPEWEYVQPERGWLLMDILMPGVWLCPVLQDPAHLRRWFSGTPHGLVDLVPLEADAECLSRYRLLILPGWNTMREEDVGALATFAERGGTLVLGLPQLQTSADRTQVISQGPRDFISADCMARLCGLRLADAVRDAGAVDHDGAHFDLVDAADGPVHLADVVLERTARAAASAGDRPIVVEHSLGRGRVFTFTAVDYFGHRGLLPFAKAWTTRLLEGFDFDIRLEGGDGEVAFFAYPEEGRTRVFLINTDWTVAGNRKTCRLVCGSQSYPVTVTEGQVSEILVKSPN